MFKNLFKKKISQSAEQDPLVPTPIPALITILLNKEKEKGEPLSEAEVIEIRDKCVCIMLPQSKKLAMDETRGYADINPEFAWEHWQQVRAELHGSSYRTTY